MASSQKDVSTLNLSSTVVNWKCSPSAKAASKTEAWWCSSRTTPLFSTPTAPLSWWVLGHTTSASAQQAWTPCSSNCTCHSIAKHSSWPWTVTVSSARATSTNAIAASKSSTTKNISAPPTSWTTSKKKCLWNVRRTSPQDAILSSRLQTPAPTTFWCVPSTTVCWATRPTT